MRSARVTALPPFLLGKGKRFQHGLCQLFFAVRREILGMPTAHFAHGRDIRGYHRNAGSKRLKRRQAEAFIARGENQGRCTAHEASQPLLIHKSGKTNAPRTNGRECFRGCLRAAKAAVFARQHEIYIAAFCNFCKRAT